MILSNQHNFACKKIAVLIALALLPSANLYAEETQKIEEIFVTATRSEHILNDVIGSAAVITAAEIKALQPYDLNDLLETQTGVDMLRSGSRGAQSSLMIRGATANQSLVLVNGQRIASATLGTSNYTLLPPEMLARVEIVKGANSSLYGSDAIGGVVNAITYNADNSAPGVNLSFDYGSNAYYRDAIAASTKAADLHFALGFAREASDGIDSTVSKAANQDDRDGFKRLGGAIALDYVPNDNDRISFVRLENSSEADFDNGSSPKPYSDAKLTFNQLVAHKKVDDFYKVELAVSQTLDQSETKDHEIVPWPSRYETKNANASWLNYFSVASQQFILGYDFTKATIDSTDNFVNANSGQAVNGRDSEAGFIAFNGAVGILSYNLGARVDDLKELGNHDTQNAGVALEFIPGQQIYIRYAEGFRAPTLNDLYSPWGGNANLKPEESEQYEVGHKIVLDKFEAQVAVYNNDVTNLIEWRPVSEYVWSPFNVGEARLRGTELSLAYTSENYGQFKLGADYLEATDTLLDKPLNYRPKRKLTLQWLKAINAWQLGLQSKLQSERTEPYAKLAGYGLLNATVAYQLNENFLINLKVINLLDKDYQLKSAYSEDGRNLLLGIRASF